MYDYVFVTHIPSFYRVNLYNELNKTLKIFVIFLGDNSHIRTADFVLKEAHFDHVILNTGKFEDRNKLLSFFRVWKSIRQLQYKKLVVAGWEIIEFWFFVFLSPTAKNALALESTDYESKQSGVKAFLKRLFLSRVPFVFASGRPHRALLEALQYKGEIQIVKGVGLINRSNRALIVSKSYQKRFLYIGRLVSEKNLPFLIEVFQNLPDCTLSLVGSGPEYEHLKSIATSNIQFFGHVENTRLTRFFEESDFLILPSTSETWGLVVEEAIYNYLPVMISDACGVKELIEDQRVIFSPYDVKALVNKIRSIDSKEYESILQGFRNIDIDQKDQRQIAVYRQAIQ